MIAIELEASDQRPHQILDVLVDQIKTWLPLFVRNPENDPFENDL
jgi:hypothetical protein